MIHFKFKELDDITLFNDAESKYVNWVSLTDGELWLKFGKTVIYEYSEEAIKEWMKPNKYNDYFISRFIEDFSSVFAKLSEEVPEDIFQYTSSLSSYRIKTEGAIDYEDSSTQAASNTITYEEFCILNNWISERSFHSSHLKYGPNLSFFRCNGVLRVVWDTSGVLLNGALVWLSKSGYYDLAYKDFIAQVSRFADAFFSELEKRIKLAEKKSWDKAQMDIQTIIWEQNERKKDFFNLLEVLKSEPLESDEWTDIRKLLQRIF